MTNAPSFRNHPYVFSIRNLHVSFFGKRALWVPKLDLERGKLLCLLGNSGSGKSTFLETLGLMSSYADSDSQIVFYPNAQAPGIDYRTLWNNEEKATALRRGYFSFMFQETELFPQFSVFENVALTQIIKNTPTKRAIEAAHSKLELLEIGYQANNHPTQMSGGERQRVAFARAVLAEAYVLFADEPTGNLGEEDAKTILQDIRNYVNSNNGRNTALVVTHNIELALQYADQIIIIQDDHVIREEHIFRQVRKPSGVSVRNDSDYLTKDYIVKVLHQKNDIQLPRQPYIDRQTENFTMPELSDSEFRKFYGPRSTQDLSLRKRANFILAAVLLTTFCAIGFSVGSIEVLREKMADPFVNWLTVEITRDQQEQLRQLFEFFSQKEINEKYAVQDVSGFHRYQLNIFNDLLGGTIVLSGRTIHHRDKIFSKLENPTNLLYGGSFVDSMDIGLIVTESFLEKSGVKIGKPFVNISMPVQMGDNRRDIPVPIPIRAVVRSLPGRTEFLSTDYFKIMKDHDSQQPFNPTNANGIRIFCLGPRENAVIVSDSLMNFVQAIDTLAKRHPYIDIAITPREHLPFQEGYVVEASFLPPLHWSEAVQLFTSFKSQYNFTFPLTFLYRYPTSSTEPTAEYQKFNRLSILVGNLDGLPILRELLSQKFGIELDLAKVESLNNYRALTRLTSILSLGIITISIFSVCILMVYILYLHLYKNRLYLGMLKAFGALPRTLKSIYLRRMLSSLTFSLSFAFLLSVLLGYTGLVRSAVSLLIPIEDKHLYFNLENPYPALFAVLLLTFCFLSLSITARLILGRQPGDLIYDRISNAKQMTKTD